MWFFFIPPHTRTHNQIIIVLFGSTYTYPQTISMMKLSIDIDPMFITYPSKIIVYMEQYTLFIYEISFINYLHHSASTLKGNAALFLLLYCEDNIKNITCPAEHVPGKLAYSQLHSKTHTCRNMNTSQVVFLMLLLTDIKYGVR